MHNPQPTNYAPPYSSLTSELTPYQILSLVNICARYIMSYLDASATEALLEEDVAKKKAATDEKPIALKIFFYFLNVVSWSPLLCAFLIRDKKIAITAAAGAALVNFCLSGIYYKLGGTKSWPKILDISFLSSFGLATILAWTLPSEKVEVLASFLDVIIFGGFAVVISVAWGCFGVRFTEQMVVDFHSEEELSHPSMDWYHTFCTTMFLIGFFVMAGFAATGGVLTMTGNITPTLRIIVTSIYYSLLGIMLFTAYILVPNCYMRTKHFENLLMKKYGDELYAWEAAHPDHEWAQ